MAVVRRIARWLLHGYDDSAADYALRVGAGMLTFVAAIGGLVLIVVLTFVVARSL